MDRVRWSWEAHVFSFSSSAEEEKSQNPCVTMGHSVSVGKGHMWLGTFLASSREEETM
jgi:hypothetical protein